MYVCVLPLGGYSFLDMNEFMEEEAQIRVMQSGTIQGPLIMAWSQQTLVFSFLFYSGEAG